MDEKSFCYWLQGYFELTDSTELTENQISIIKDHLDLVFDKVTPRRTEPVKCVKPALYPPSGRKYC